MGPRALKVRQLVGPALCLEGKRASMLVMVGNSICRHSGQEHLWPVAEMWEFVPVLDRFGKNLTGSDVRPMLYFLSHLFS